MTVHTIDWIGPVAIGTVRPDGKPAAFSLEEGQVVPSEFVAGDLVEVEVHPDPLPAELIAFLGRESDGFYQFKHLKSGVTLKTYHRADMYKVRD